VHLTIFISVINQLDAQHFYFTISLFHASTCFEGTAVAQWLRCCATYRKVACSIPACVIGVFIDIKSFLSHYGSGVDLASNRNEYQEHFLGSKVGRCVRLTTYHHPVPLSRNLGTLTSCNPLGHSRPVMGLIFYMFRSQSTHHQEVKILLYSIWYHHTYMCDDTRGCVMQFWPPDDEHICSKHVGEWNKLIVKQKFCALSWLTDKTLFHSMQKCGEGTRQVKADRKLVGRKKCDVKLGEVSQKWEKLYLMIIILMVIYQV